MKEDLIDLALISKEDINIHGSVACLFAHLCYPVKS